MYEKGAPLEIGGVKYNLVFTTAALLEVDDRYEGIQEMVEKFNGPEDADDDTPEQLAEKAKSRKKARSSSLHEIPWLVATMANQGIMLENGGKAEGLVRPEEIALRLPPKDMSTALNAAMKAISIGMGTYVETSESADRDLGLEEVEKNSEGAGA